MKPNQVLFICDLRDYTVSRTTYYTDGRLASAEVIDEFKRTTKRGNNPSLFVKRDFSQALTSVLDEYRDNLILKFKAKYGEQLSCAIIDQIAQEVEKRKQMLITLNKINFNHN